MNKFLTPFKGQDWNERLALSTCRSQKDRATISRPDYRVNSMQLSTLMRLVHSNHLNVIQCGTVVNHPRLFQRECRRWPTIWRREKFRVAKGDHFLTSLAGSMKAGLRRSKSSVRKLARKRNLVSYRLKASPSLR